MITQDLDLGTVLRLRAAADALADVGGNPRVDAMERRNGDVAILNRVKALVTATVNALDAKRAELLRDLVVEPGTDFIGDSPENGPAVLGVLRGYLQGCVEELTFEAQMRANAEAYGEAKARAEKGYL
jgi:hypothetical protein